MVKGKSKKQIEKELEKEKQKDGKLIEKEKEEVGTVSYNNKYYIIINI